MYSFKWILFVIFILNLYNTRAEISDKRKCFDKECKEPLSLAKTILRYSSPDSRILSFKPNVEAIIYSKEAGSDTTLWGAEIDGKRGYIPKSYVREYKVLKKPKVLVSTEIGNDEDTPKVPEENEAKIEPEKSSEFDVVDGTTIYYDNKVDISPSSTSEPLLATETTNINEEAEEMSVEEDDDGSEDDEEDDEEEDNPKASEEVKNTENSTETPELAPYSLKVDLNEPNLIEKGGNVNETNLDSNTVTQAPVIIENSPLDPVLEPVTENPGALKDDGNSVDENAKKETEDSLKSGIPAVPPLVLLKSTLDTNKNELNETKSSEIEKNHNKSENIEEKADSSQLNEKIDVKNENIEEKTDSPQLNEKSEINLENIKINQNVTENKSNENVEYPNKEKVEEIIEKVPDSSTILPSLSAFGLFGNVNEQNTEPIQEASTEEPNLDLNNNLAEPTTGDSKENVEKIVDNKQHEEKNVQIDEIQEKENNGLNNVENVNVKEEIHLDGLNNSQSEEIKNVEDKQKEEIGSESGQFNQELNENVKSNNGELNNLPTEENHEKLLDSITTEVPPVLQHTEIKQEESKEEIQSENDLHFEEATSPQSETFSQETEEGPGFLSGIFSFFSSPSSESSIEEETLSAVEPNIEAVPPSNNFDSVIDKEEAKPIEENIWTINKESKDASNDEPPSQCITSEEELSSSSFIPDFDFDFKLNFNSDIFLYLVTTAVSVILFLFGYLFYDKSQREGPLIARINKLEKELIIALKENEILQESSESKTGNIPAANYEIINNEEEVQELKEQLAEMEKTKLALEEQVQALEKELDTSTEVGIELNRILSEMLKSPDGDENMKANVELLQKQLVEQQTTIANVNDALSLKETENHELHLELEISNKKVMDLQGELDGMVEKILKIEEERDQQQQILERELGIYQDKCKQLTLKLEEKHLETVTMQTKLADTERLLQIKENEFKSLKDSINQIKLNNTDLKSLLEVTKIKAELEQLRAENSSYKDRIQEEREARDLYEKRAQSAMEEAGEMRAKYEQADKEKVEINTKLEVLNNYFKEREAQLQKELSKYEELWAAKEGEATSTTERFKYMQEELQNYKAQYESLKQEIISQEVDLKSQISMLEKKAHENWVMARQNERKMQDAQQEAAQLRNRLTMRERAFEDKTQNRMTSPLEQNGDLPISPHPIESPASPPLIYGGRDHLTKSPPLPGLPPFLPPPPGAPFMPPPLPLGMPPFMPPPPHTMLPGDHRPPPLGRMSSPPLNSRYSPDSSVFSPYERNSPSPTYDSEYGTSPPMRGYSPYRERDDKRPRREVYRNGRHSKLSSESDQSIGSIEKVRKPPKV